MPIAEACVLINPLLLLLLLPSQLTLPGVGQDISCASSKAPCTSQQRQCKHLLNTPSQSHGIKPSVVTMLGMLHPSYSMLLGKCTQWSWSCPCGMPQAM